MNFGPWQLAVILIIILIIFGAGKLPQLFSSMGQAVRGFREGANGTDEEVEKPKKKRKAAKTTKSTQADKTDKTGQ